MLAVVINEIHANPDESVERVEFIELYNAGSSTVDLAGWRIDEAVDYTFPAGSSIAPDEYLVITQDTVDFQAKFGFAPFGQWETGDKLSNEGETIELLNVDEELMDTVTYQLGFPWPTTGDFGNSIELIHPEFDNDLAGNWRSSGSRIVVEPTFIAEQASDWRYRRGVSEPPGDWNEPDFVEESDTEPWETGQTSIGFGDGDDNTVLTDMRGNYTTVYLRNEFTISDAVLDALTLRLYVDDGAIVYINGVEVERPHVSDGRKQFDDVTGTNDHEAQWEEFQLTGASSYLNAGTNTIAVQVINSSPNSSDLSFDAELLVGQGGNPTPGAQNSVFADNAPPLMRQLSQSELQPASGQDVTITMKVTDSDGVQDVVLDYQLVNPGNYVRLTDAAYETNWTTLAMHDDGLNGDAVAGDDVFTVVLPGSLQVHRRLVRYRITASDTLGGTVIGPYADDPQPNFAYFVYDGVPDYTASLRPGFEPNMTYAGDVLDEMATYHLIANAQDVQNSQYNPAFDEVLFNGTLVYEGIVYDHIHFRNRGVASTYQVGKNKWKLEFLRGHFFEARDNYGNLYQEALDEINVLPGTNPWWRNNVSTEGTVLFEPVAFKLYELAGTPSSNTHYFQFRVIDGASEAGNNQYAGDYWGLYIGIEQPDGRFLDERGLPDGNIFNMHGSAFGSTTQRNQGSDLPTDRSDLIEFLAGIDGGFETLEWWEENLNFDSYFAWNIVNHAVNNSDIRPDENVDYYHNQETGQWYILPWDLDLTFEDAPHLGNPVTNREDIRTLMEDHPEARIAYENRLRELVDLLFDNQDAALVVEEFAKVLTLGGSDLSILNANQAQWDYHPQKVKPGIWYENFNQNLLPSEDFGGLVTYMQDFLSPGGYGYNLMVRLGDESLVPDTPMISYAGVPEFPTDGLVFATTPFEAPQGADAFAAIEWRLAEVYNSSVTNYDPSQPYVYEIEGTWESGELPTFSDQVAIPTNAVTAGKTYRARVRMQDEAGRWSHWSEPIEFVANSAASSPTVAIVEVHYHPADSPGLEDSQDLEFIEILNYGTETVSLTGVQLAEFALPIVYEFNSGLNLAPGERIVVARDPVTFASVYGDGINLAPTGFKFDGKNLSNSGERIVLLGPSNEVLQDFTYSDDAPWPTAADGDGPSLEIIDPIGDPNDPANWRASLVDGGTPGTDGPPGMLAGDYDRNGTVETTDYTLWNSTFGATVAPGTGADGNGDGTINAADYTVWRNNLGHAMDASAVLGGSLSANLAVTVTESSTSTDAANGPIDVALVPNDSFRKVGEPIVDVAFAKSALPPLPPRTTAQPSSLLYVNPPILPSKVPWLASRSERLTRSLRSKPADLSETAHGWNPPETDVLSAVLGELFPGESMKSR